MHVLVNSDNHITGAESLTARIENTVHNALEHFDERITRVEVHLNDVNSHKGGPADKRCMMEARLGGLKPIAVSHQAGSLDDAIQGAADKLARAIGSTLGRLDAKAGRAPPQSEISDVERLRRLEEDEARRGRARDS